MADEKIIFGIDLDTKQAAEKALDLSKTLKEVANVEGMQGMLSIFAEMAPVLGVLAVAGYAMKKAFDFTLEAEQIEKIQKQFEMLTKNAGVASTELMEGLKKASYGLIDDTDLMEAANKSLVTMGASAARLPEIMQLAAKLTQVFGGELKDNFENLTRSIDTGNTRLLRQYRITVDNNKVIKEYASAHGMAANELNELGKKQAIANAILENGNKKYKDISVATDTATISWKQLKTTLTEVGEQMAITGKALWGDAVQFGLASLKSAATGVANFFKQFTGTDAEKAELQLERTKERLKDYQMEYLKAEKGSVHESVIAGYIARDKKHLEELEAKIHGVKEEAKGGVVAETKGTSPEGKSEQVDYEKRALNKTKFEADMLRIREKRNKAEIDLLHKESEDEKLFEEQKKIAIEQSELKKIEIDQKDYLNEQQKRQMKIQEDQLLADQLKMIEQDKAEFMIKMDDKRAQSSKKASEGMAAGIRKAARDGTKDMDSFGKASGVAFGFFMNRSTEALKAFAEGSMTASEAARAVMLGMIADMAEAAGRFMMLDAFQDFPTVNYPELAAGAGLVALSGAIGAMGGKKGGSLGSSGGGGAGGGSMDMGAAAQSTTQSPTLTQDQMKQKTVTFQVQGNIFNTSETQRTIMEMIRQETDATDFKYIQVGG